MSVQKSISILKLWIFLFYSANHGRAETSDFTTNVSEVRIKPFKKASCKEN